MPITLQDIAREAEVSKTVASDILRGAGSSRFGPETRQRVLAAARKLDYTPNRSARALATGRTELIALWMPHLLSAYYARIAYLIELKLRATKYDLLIAHLESASFPQADGVLCLVDSYDAAVESLAAHQRMKSHGASPALCLLGCGVDAVKFKDTDYVGVELGEATRAAVRHLLDSGCRRIAFLSGAVICSPREMRFAAYSVAMTKAGRTPEAIGIEEWVSDPRGAAYDTVRQRYAQGSFPDGLICLNDELAIGALRALHDCGARVPHDVAVVGCDGITDTRYIEPGLSTLVQPVEEMCERAWEVLQRRIASPDAPPCHIELKALLEIRQSSSR